MGIVPNLGAADQLGEYRRQATTAGQASKSAATENDSDPVHAYALDVRWRYVGGHGQP